MAFVAVTGATGHIGGAVARAFAARGVPQRLVVRDASRAPALPRSEVAVASYGDYDAMLAAFTGVRHVLLVSAAEAEDRLSQHLTAVRAAKDAGVERVVYTSFQGASPTCTFTLGRDHWATEVALAETGLTVTILRDSFYADFLPAMTGADGVLRGPAGSGRVAAVARADVAASAAALLLAAMHGDDRHDGATYTLTGPEALTLSEAAAIMGEAAGRPVVHEDETVRQAYASRAHYGAPGWEVDAWVSTYTAIANDEVAEVTDHVELLSGKEPRSFAQLLDQEPSLLDGLRGGNGP